jgi:putative addiction module CopG family antidote
MRRTGFSGAERLLLIELAMWVFVNLRDDLMIPRTAAGHDKRRHGSGKCHHPGIQKERLKNMKIDLSPAQSELIRQAIRAGRLGSAEEAVREALELWEARERSRAEILEMLDAAEASLARGEGLIVTEETMDQLVEEVHRRGLAHIAAERGSTHSRTPIHHFLPD